VGTEPGRERGGEPKISAKKTKKKKLHELAEDERIRKILDRTKRAKVVGKKCLGKGTCWVEGDGGEGHCGSDRRHEGPKRSGWGREERPLPKHRKTSH